MDYIKEKCTNAGVPYEIVRILFVPHYEVPRLMQAGDFGICPVKPVPTKRYCTPVKDGEYWAMGLPVIITNNISDDSDIIREHSAGAVLENLNQQGYADAVAKMNCILRQDKKELQKKIRTLAERYRNYEIAEEIYRNFYQ